MIVSEIFLLAGFEQFIFRWNLLREFFANLFSKLRGFRLLTIGVIETHDNQSALRANIRETPVVPLINEQGEKETTVCPELSSSRSNTVVDLPFISITGIPFSTTCRSAQEDFFPIFPESVEAKITLFLDFGVWPCKPR